MNMEIVDRKCGWIAIAACLCMGCQGEELENRGGIRDSQIHQRESARTGPIQAVATVGMVGDLVREIGGERVAVRVLMRSGVDPHLYKATRTDVLALLEAEIVFQNGLMLEGKMVHVLKRTGQSRPVWSVGEEVLAQTGDLILGGDHIDPHLWMDISMWVRAARIIHQRLADFDPAGSDYYAARTEDLVDRLNGLHGYAQKVIATIPESSRVLVTSHDAFGWFGRAYGFEVFGVQGLSTESEAGLRRVNSLVKLISDRQVPAVFLESSVPARGIAALVDGVRARGQTVNIAGPLYSDALGPAGTYEGTYLGMLDHNITMIADELGGSPPAGGWQGFLSSANAPQSQKHGVVLESKP
ncbi:MAG TPA: zinc ABC transporter substrate-binding protein [Pirellulaceae bacterium]|nr:zinc ABC transporter substrate-binding protein [Pirellulaceae bacterium]